MEEVQALLPNFKEYITKIQEEQGYDLLVMMFSNIMAEGSLFVYSGKLKGIMEDIVDTVIDDMTGFDNLIISRKQQMMPKVFEIVKSL